MTTELDDLVAFLEGQRQAVLRNLEGLSDAEATTATAVSSMPLLGIVKHLSFVERRWIHMGGDAQSLDGCYPPDPDKEFDVAGESVAAGSAAPDGWLVPTEGRQTSSRSENFEATGSTRSAPSPGRPPR